MKRPVLLTIAIATVTTAALVGPGGALAAPSSGETAVYLVQLAGNPLASYAGGVSGIPATKPVPGTKLDRSTWNYEAYRTHLRAQRSSAFKASGVAGSKAITEYDTAFNGFAVRLTAAEAARMAKTPGVVRLFENEVHEAHTTGTPAFLGMSGPAGVWQRQFGSPEHAGEGIIIGVIDSGFWPENPSFAALPEPRPDAEIIAAKWRGACVAGTEAPVACNNKVIGARYYHSAAAPGEHPEETESPRDRNGHGSHTSSTAAGNPAEAVVAGASLGTASGMAPSARIAVYKALWHQTNGNASGTSVDIVAAIDDAVADGVDVLNYSIGNSVDNFTATELAFFHAAAAGVFIAASAGNNGPVVGSVDNTMPWQATVGAGTHDVSYSKTVTLGNGASYTGIGLGGAVPSAPLVDAEFVALPGAVNAKLCLPGTLDPAAVAGKIVLCERGTNARVEKSAVVKAAGGVGTVLWNPTPNTLNADAHEIPTVHLQPTEGAAVKAYISASSTASISATVKARAKAPQVAGLSSRGPSPFNKGDLLKPDIIAPGIDVVAAVGQQNPFGHLYDLKSGTSMAAPHIAGIAALIKQKYPAWSPAAIKSTLR